MLSKSKAADHACRFWCKDQLPQMPWPGSGEAFDRADPGVVVSTLAAGLAILCVRIEAVKPRSTPAVGWLALSAP